MNAAIVNLSDIFARFFNKNQAEDISSWLRLARAGEVSIKPLLALHRLGGGDEKNLILRTKLISLLRFYGIVEIGLVAKMLPEPTYETFWIDASQNLSFDPFRSFYENYYKSILPQFLLARLEGRLHLSEEGIDQKAAEAFYLFSSFLEIASRQEHPDIEFVLSFSKRLPAGLADMRRIVEDKERFIELVLAPDSTDAATLVQGLNRLLALCDELDRLLNTSKTLPLLQSAMWTYFSDIFQAPDNRMAELLFQTVAAFSSWVNSAPEELNDCNADIQSYIRRMFDVIERLTSGQYGIGISEPLSELSPPLVEA